MTIEHKPPRIEPVQTDDTAKYLLRSSREIAAVLRRLVDSRSLLSVHAAPGNDTFLTALLDVSGDGSMLVLDGSPDRNLNARIGQAAKLDCVTQLDKVRIQFPLERPMLQTWNGKPAFAAALPEELLRLQRREFYRLQTPVADPLNCIVPLPDAGEVSLRIIDISGGGIAIAAAPDTLSFTAGDSFPGCRIKLPDSEPITARLTVRNLFRVPTRSGAGMLRVGCEFSEMPRGAEETIQRYILKIDRQRSARQRALG